ncbi:MAG: Gfo/Idh/MocA family oxidoreductase [Burkholderiaceae bacterium]|nr:Gfo/Idh/MocA family oxidoreductase [Burkholderiaceae bacterium]
MSSQPRSRSHDFLKVVRFALIYGPSRAIYKAAGRLRFRPIAMARSTEADIGLVGCGQFAFSTIGYFLQRAFGARVLTCYDVDFTAARSLAAALRVPQVATDADQLLRTPGLRLVYIVSNHASHADYAVHALERGLDVYVEKPIAVTREQLLQLLRAMRASGRRIFAGYNRPFSAAVRTLRERTTASRDAAMSLQCFVSGHRLGPEHWYRRPEEGTRVCGNIGHWLDLFVHLLAWRGLPDRLQISVTWADDSEPDDNVSISIRSDRHDLFSVLLTSRTEPFEGINETINFQLGDTICKIDDFRSMIIWQGPRRTRYRFWPKDVGHRGAILQPFEHRGARDWHEVELSTLLTLHIADMVRQHQRQSSFSFAEQWATVEDALARPTT